MNICTGDHPSQPRQNTASLGNLVSKDAKISTNALVKCEEVECPFFIHSKQKLTLHFLSTPTVLTGYSRPTDGKEAKPAPRMTSRLRQFLHGPRLLSSIFRDLNRTLNGDHIQINTYLFLCPALFIMAWLLSSCKMKCQHAIPFSTRELQPYWTENPWSLGFLQFPL